MIAPVNARLLDVATGKTPHLYEGRCPDYVNGPESRDPDCPACQAIVSAEAQRPTDYSSTVDRAWARFCGAFGDGPDAPYPGMIAAFETHYGQSFRDKEWRTEASCWAAAWSKATARAEAALAEPQPDADGWIPWAGGKCPVDEDALVEIWRRDGVQLVGDEARPAIRWRWSNCNILSDIIAYRVEGEPK